MKNPNLALLAGSTVCLAASISAAQPDSFHLMQIEQVIGGVNGDTTKQAIQLRQRSSFQNLMNFSRVRVFDAAGANPIEVIDMTTDVPNFNAGDRILIASAGFASATTPAAVPDFIMTNLIPASYLTAGRLTFEDDGGTIYWSLSWGGASYTGSNLGSITNDPNGNFGPPFGGPCPSATAQALLFNGTASAASSTNLADYSLTTGAAVFTNNARNGFTVNAGPAPCYPNCDGTGGLTANDFACFLTAFINGQSYANCDGVGGLTANDFVCFLGTYNAGCS
jgi:hypothetical protein